MAKFNLSDGRECDATLTMARALKVGREFGPVAGSEALKTVAKLRMDPETAIAVALAITTTPDGQPLEEEALMDGPPVDAGAAADAAVAAVIEWCEAIRQPKVAEAIRRMLDTHETAMAKSVERMQAFDWHGLIETELNKAFATAAAN